jgi:hypothetical protein
MIYNWFRFSRVIVVVLYKFFLMLNVNFLCIQMIWTIVIN